MPLFQRLMRLMAHAVPGRRGRGIASVRVVAPLACVCAVLLAGIAAVSQEGGNAPVYNPHEDLEVRPRPGGLFPDLADRTWFKRGDREPDPRAFSDVRDDADLSSIKRGATDDINNIIVLVGEIPLPNTKAAVLAPIFMTNHKNIFGTISDFNFTWVGYKVTGQFKQKGFPFEKTDLSETIIGSFVHASGTNLGFIGNKYEEELRFYTNYVSEIVSMRYNFPHKLSAAFTLDSRQYFFVKRDVPDDFIMPHNHVNIFPRLDFNVDWLTETGIDQITKGFGLQSWIGYGVRSQWEKWGQPPAYEMGREAKEFIIYSVTATGGILIGDSQNIVITGRYKGGDRTDFLSRPRFGGTIDNAKLDVVHGFPVDSFRVNAFGLVNTRYSFDIFKWLRMSLFLDYAHVYSPARQDIFGSGYGFRFITIGGLPIWITHGIGKKYYPGNEEPFEQVFMVMAAAGW